jgi:glycerol-3-phosphate acyltransferase PlsY
LGDIRKVGSGNIGATNVLRTGRKGLAAATLLLDALKGAVAVLIAAQLGEIAAVGAAAGAVLGHMFPVWLAFKGGKGMATALGVMWGLAWPVGAIACAAWLAFAAIFRYSSLATLLSIVVGAIAAWFLADSRAAMLLTLLVPLVWARHHQNISRLLAGSEPRIGQRSTSGA